MIKFYTETPEGIQFLDLTPEEVSTEFYQQLIKQGIIALW